jgi:hypothetical protein
LKTWIRAVTLSAIVLLPLLLMAQSVPQLTPFSADLQLNSQRPGRSAHEATGKMYVNQQHMRMDLQEPNLRGGAIVITNFSTQTTDTLVPDQHMYMEFSADQAAARRPGMAPSIKPFKDPSNPCAGDAGSSCKKVGVEDVNGRSCDQWQITDSQGKVSNVWIDQKLHFPMKSVTSDTSWELSNVKEGEQEASLFEIPSGYQKMDLGQMMQGMRPPQQ